MIVIEAMYCAQMSTGQTSVMIVVKLFCKTKCLIKVDSCSYRVSRILFDNSRIIKRKHFLTLGRVILVVVICDRDY